MRRKTKVWLDGFINGIVNGGVTSVMSALGIVAAESAGVQIKGLGIDQICGIFFSSCLVSACIYIKQNQLPPIFNGGEETAPPFKVIQEEKTTITTEVTKPKEEQK